MAAGWHEAASGLFITVAGASVKGSFLIGPLILVVFFLRRLSAALRSSLLASAFCGLLFLTIVPVTGRHIRWSISLPVRHAMHTPVSGTSPAITGKGEIGQPASATAVSAETQAPPRRGWDIVAVLGLVWAAGCLIGLFQLGGGYCSLRRLRKKAVTVSDHPWREEAIQSAAALGLRRRIGLVFAERLETPATCGVSRPLVLLPAAAASWPEGCRRMVLLHELSHVKRYDVLWRTLARLIAAVHWFNPLVWLALRELLAAQEEACDSHVLEGGVAAGDYARHLLAMLRPPGRRIVSCPGAVDGIVRFERRIRTIMSWTKRNTRWKPLHYGILSVVFLACVLLGGVGVRADDAPEDITAVNGPSLLALPFSGVKDFWAGNTNGPKYIFRCAGTPTSFVTKNGQIERAKALIRLWNSGGSGEVQVKLELEENGELLDRMVKKIRVPGETMFDGWVTLAVEQPPKDKEIRINLNVDMGQHREICTWLFYNIARFKRIVDFTLTELSLDEHTKTMDSEQYGLTEHELLELFAKKD